MNKNPVIIIGMHRSGTSLLVSVLEQLGYFMGRDKEKNNESLFFLKMNEWMMAQAGARWDSPHNWLAADDDFKKLMSNIMKNKIDSILSVRYSGITNYFKWKQKDSFLWGWKDPRNTFTIDVWDRVFDSPKIIHIYRNPVDVALSLCKREKLGRESFKLKGRDKLKTLLLKGRLSYGISPRVYHMEEGIRLWHDYVSKALNIHKELGVEVCHVKYEDLVYKPEEEIDKIISFLNIAADGESVIERISNSVDSQKAYSFSSSPDLMSLYKTLLDDPLINLLGYKDESLK